MEVVLLSILMMFSVFLTASAPRVLIKKKKKMKASF